MPSDPPKAYLSWSSGKDAAFALHEVRRLGLADIVGVLTTVSEARGRVAVHDVRDTLLDRQIAALGLPAMKVTLPSPCPNAVYEARMAEACGRLKGEGVAHVVFGDLFLADIRQYREETFAKFGMGCLFPLWARDTRQLARDMIDSGIEAHVACLDPARLDRSFAGRRFDAAMLAALPDGVDPCGENGEFHTVVTAGPDFAAPIPVSIGEIAERAGFVYADIVPAAAQEA